MGIFFADFRNRNFLRGFMSGGFIHGTIYPRKYQYGNIT